MENHKIDRLFQDKLSRHEVDPSPQAWEAINAELKKDNKPFFWLSIAASVAILATVGFLFTRKGQETLPMDYANHAVDQPTPQPQYQWNLSIPEKEVQTEEAKPVKKYVPKVMKPSSKETLAKQVETSFDEFMPEVESLGLDAVADVVIEDVQDEEMLELDTAPIQSLPGVGVQITYKATPPAPVEEKSRIERLWAKAKEIKPGDVLADIRETKNDFFNGKRN